MYQAIHEFKPLREISLREAEELDFGTFVTISSYLVRGICEEPRSLTLLGQEGDTTPAELPQAQQRDYYKALQRDLGTSLDLGDKLDRKHCVLDMCKRFDGLRFQRYQERQLALQRKRRAQLEDETRSKNASQEHGASGAGGTQRVQKVEREQQLKRSWQPEQEYGAHGAQERQCSRELRENSSVADATSADGHFRAARRVTKAPFNGSFDGARFGASEPSLIRELAPWLALRKISVEGQDLLYYSAEELYALQMRLNDAETRLNKVLAQLHAFSQLNVDLRERAARLDSAVCTLERQLEAACILPEFRAPALSITQQAREIVNNSRQLLHFARDFEYEREVLAGLERVGGRDALFRRRTLAEFEALAQAGQGVVDALGAAEPMDVVGARRLITEFSGKLTCFIAQTLRSRALETNYPIRLRGGEDREAQEEKPPNAAQAECANQ